MSQQNNDVAKNNTWEGLMDSRGLEVSLNAKVKIKIVYQHLVTQQKMLQASHFFLLLCA